MCGHVGLVRDVTRLLVLVIFGLERLLLLGTVVLAVLLLTAAGLAFNSGFQTWAARRALAGRPGLEVSLGQLSAGLGRVRVDRVRVTQSGAVLTLPAAYV